MERIPIGRIAASWRGAGRNIVAGAAVAVLRWLGVPRLETMINPDALGSPAEPAGAYFFERQGQQVFVSNAGHSAARRRGARRGK
jgi:hypothetical protein